MPETRAASSLSECVVGAFPRFATFPAPCFPVPKPLKHGFDSAVGQGVAVAAGLDIDDHLFAHGDVAIDGGRHHMEQQQHVIQFQQFRIDDGFLLEHIKPGFGLSSECERKSTTAIRCPCFWRVLLVVLPS